MFATALCTSSVSVSQRSGPAYPIPCILLHPICPRACMQATWTYGHFCIRLSWPHHCTLWCGTCPRSCTQVSSRRWCSQTCAAAVWSWHVTAHASRTIDVSERREPSDGANRASGAEGTRVEAVADATWQRVGPGRAGRDHVLRGGGGTGAGEGGVARLAWRDGWKHVVSTVSKKDEKRGTKDARRAAESQGRPGRGQRDPRGRGISP